MFDEVPQEQINEMIRDGTEEHFIIFNDTHDDSLPVYKKSDEMGGALQSHHALQQEWAKENLAKYGYSAGKAPTVTLESYGEYPHAIINKRQNKRRDERVAAGKDKWDSTLQEELSYLVSDFRAAGFSDKTIEKVLEQQYKMLDKLKVPYERVNLKKINMKG